MTLSRLQPPFGVLHWDEELGWWRSEPFPLPIFEGKAARVRIDPDQPDDASAPFAEDVIEAGRAFLSLQPNALDEVSDHAWAYYDLMRRSWEDCPIIPAGSRIWGHVTPVGMSIERREDGCAFVSVECDCDWEPEHGLQLVAQNGVRWVRVSDFSGHLTDGAAYACDALDEWMKDPTAALPLRSFEEVMRIVSRKRKGRR
jgi:hypothetical protein